MKPANLRKVLTGSVVVDRINGLFMILHRIDYVADKGTVWTFIDWQGNKREYDWSRGYDRLSVIRLA